MNSHQSNGVSERQTRYFLENPDKAIALLKVLKRLLAWEATMGGWEASVWGDAQSAVEEVES